MTKWVFQSKKKPRKPPSLPTPILASFPAGSGRQASQPRFDAAGKYDEVGIPVKKKNAEKKPVDECTRWHVVPSGPGMAHHSRRPGAWWHVCKNTVSKEKYRETKLLCKNQNISQSFGFLARVYMIVTNSQFCTGV